MTCNKQDEVFARRRSIHTYTDGQTNERCAAAVGLESTKGSVVTRCRPRRCRAGDTMPPLNQLPSLPPGLPRLFSTGLLPLLQLLLLHLQLMPLLAEGALSFNVSRQLTLETVVWEGSDHVPLSSPSAVSCVHCALLCSRAQDCATVSCPPGGCRLFGCPPGFQLLPGGRCQEQCDAGWSRHGNNCYITETTSGLFKNWDDSQAHCASLRPGAQLASVHSAEENEFVTNLYKENGYPRGAWIGLEHLAASPDASLEFRWSDGTALDFTQWGEGQPNNDADDPLGVFVNSNGEWIDFRKTQAQDLTQICKYTLN